MQLCRPSRWKLDPEGPVPIQGITGAELLWGMKYRCSVCLRKPSSEIETPGLREFSTITQSAIAVLPHHIQRSLELYVCSPAALANEFTTTDTDAPLSEAAPPLSASSLASSLPPQSGQASGGQTQTKVRVSAE